ncbi:hypothetical protein DOY81_011066 [Sarcophaga bullata]|nr:hypothetical protein DOY81_011066 [Sarcophaga bullata]
MDYLLVPQSVIEPSGERASYFCGRSINQKEIVSTNPGPLMAIFNSDGSYFKESGFSFHYQVTSE